MAFLMVLAAVSGAHGNACPDGCGCWVPAPRRKGTFTGRFECSRPIYTRPPTRPSRDDSP
jgi:hypothetical protein